MPKNFFKEMQQARIATEIHQFLQNAIDLTTLSDSDLAERKNQLSEYLEDDISERLKRALYKAQTGVEAQIKENRDATSLATEMLIEVPECLIQIPAAKDLRQMKGMPAGLDEDQETRLSHMAEVINTHSTLPVLTSDELQFSTKWQTLFNLIDQGKKKKALVLLDEMADDDQLLKLILSVHTMEYLHQIVSYCIDAQSSGFKALNPDVVLSPKTFEVLIKDLAVTIEHQAKFYCSFGLPSHHAYSDAGSGFCILNKVAILIQHTEQSHEKPLRHVIIGTDVNRDNGLCEVLRQSSAHLLLTHIDVFDSRVYPQQNDECIDEEFQKKGKEIATGIKCWPHKKMSYFAVDLSTCIRSKNTIHPALLFALEELTEQIRRARIKTQKVMIYLPTGWDSHEQETAECGKLVAGKMMTKAAAQKHRFNNNDLVYFYKQVVELYQNNKECIEGVYWGLEGGYDKTMYEQQIELMLTTLSAQLEAQNVDSPMLEM